MLWSVGKPETNEPLGREQMEKCEPFRIGSVLDGSVLRCIFFVRTQSKDDSQCTVEATSAEDLIKRLTFGG